MVYTFEHIYLKSNAAVAGLGIPTRSAPVSRT